MRDEDEPGVAVEIRTGISDELPAPTLIKVGGKTQFRHVVANAGEALALLRGRLYPLALGGHMHARESLRYYRVKDGSIDGGTFIPLDPTPASTMRRRSAT